MGFAEASPRGLPADRASGDRPSLAVAGAGLMGAEIAVGFALRGFIVHVLVRDLARGQAAIERTIGRAQELGLLHDGMEATTGRLRVVTQVADLPRSLAVAVESVPEDLELKATVLGAIGRHAPAAVLATNTSSLSISELGMRAGVPDRTIGLHYWNPPLLMPLVEVTRGAQTSDQAVATARAIVEAAGKTPVLVRHDVPGFIWNRLQMAILREALWLVQQGVASLDDIDLVTQLGLARRWRYASLFASVYLGGAAQWEVIANNLFPHLSNAASADGLAQLVTDEDDRWDGVVDRRDLALARDEANGTGPASIPTAPTGAEP